MTDTERTKRWVIISASVAWQRIITEECLKLFNVFSLQFSLMLLLRYVTQRKVFGGTLGSQAVIRSKLAAMISRVESSQQWLENITYQMSNMTYAQQANELAGLMLSSLCSVFFATDSGSYHLGQLHCARCLLLDLPRTPLETPLKFVVYLFIVSLVSQHLKPSRLDIWRPRTDTFWDGQIH